jgi:hypothetical protein
LRAQLSHGGTPSSYLRQSSRNSQESLPKPIVKLSSAALLSVRRLQVNDGVHFKVDRLHDL